MPREQRNGKWSKTTTQSAVKSRKLNGKKTAAGSESQREEGAWCLGRGRVLKGEGLLLAG